jgi:hypothetical protein
MTASDFCAARYIFSCHAGGHPHMRRREFIALIGWRVAVWSRTRAAALPTDRPIRNARVPQAIGQSFDWLVPAEAEVLGARVADRERRHQHLMLGEDVQARTL